jgi:glyoxylase-like metal-dependent hydrolase (beta-lactamase superfamily II)
MPQEVFKTVKPPRVVLEGLLAFSPNRETLGGTAYFILENTGNVLIDCPAWEAENRQFIADNGGVRWLFITHRGGMSPNIGQIQADFGCEVLVQEQEAYLLPKVKVNTFERELFFEDDRAIWTPGHSPGSSCFYWHRHGGVLFSGRHLLPDRDGNPVPLRTKKTFHWLRQLNSVELLRDRFNDETLNYLCPGANTGFLRGKTAIARPYGALSQLDLQALRQTKFFF